MIKYNFKIIILIRKKYLKSINMMVIAKIKHLKITVNILEI